MKLSIVIPAYNEGETIEEMIHNLVKEIEANNIEYEIYIVDDNSNDDTLSKIEDLAKSYNSIKYETNLGPNGYGYAVRYGLERFSGDCVAIMMADMSETPNDLIRFYRKMEEGNYDCVFGSRFITGGKAYDYPWVKRIINRMANSIIQLVMNIRYNDTTNAFKLYKKETIEGIQPILAPHFNLTIELPLKAIIRGFSYTIIPNYWFNRKLGTSKLKIREMGSRYFFILMYCLIEKYFSKGDFNKKW